MGHRNDLAPNPSPPPPSEKILDILLLNIKFIMQSDYYIVLGGSTRLSLNELCLFKLK